LVKCKAGVLQEDASFFVPRCLTQGRVDSLTLPPASSYTLLVVSHTAADIHSHSAGHIPLGTSAFCRPPVRSRGLLPPSPVQVPNEIAVADRARRMGNLLSSPTVLPV